MKILIKKIITLFGFYFNKNLINRETPIGIHKLESIKSSYSYFNKYFNNSVLFDEVDELRNYGITSIISELGKDDLIMEFGVYEGGSINLFSKALSKYKKNNIIYGFDSFTGLDDDWLGNINHPIGSLNKNKIIPKVNNNIKLIVGRVEETLENFLTEHNNEKIIFIHLDLDLYSPTIFVLKNIKKLLKKRAIIIFDQLYGYPNWESNEFKAFRETFNDEEFSYLAFGPRQVIIRYK